MKLQDLPKTAAETTANLVKLPVELVTKAREAVEKQFGGGNGADVQEPAVEPTKAKTAKPKATPKKPAAKKPATRKPAAKKAATKKPAAKKPATKKPTSASAASSPTPANTAPAAERAAVIDEQTDGLDDAVDRAQFQLHKRDVDVNSGEQR